MESDTFPILVEEGQSCLFTQQSLPRLAKGTNPRSKANAGILPGVSICQMILLLNKPFH